MKIWNSEILLQLAAPKSEGRKPPCALQDKKQKTGNLPADCRAKNGAPESFLQSAGELYNILFSN